MYKSDISDNVSKQSKHTYMVKTVILALGFIVI